MDMLLVLAGPGLLAVGAWLLNQGQELWALVALGLGALALGSAVFYVGSGRRGQQTFIAAPRRLAPPAAPGRVIGHAPVPLAPAHESPHLADPDDVDEARLVTLADDSQRPVVATLATWEAFDLLVARTDDAEQALAQLATERAERDGISLDAAFAHVVMRAHAQITASD